MNHSTTSLFFFLCTVTTISSSVHFPPEAHPTNSGYLPVSTQTNSSLFYAFYESQAETTPFTQTPILIWLQGGPGCSSMVANFFELGPYLIHNTSTTSTTIPPILTPNPYSWNRKFGLLFIDNPIGTGFSIASSPEEIPTDQIGVARHLWSGLQYFLDSNPGFRSRPLYLTGESYAGKYVPATGWYILKMNGKSKSRRIRLEGVAIGNGLTHPLVQVATHADTAYQIGLINAKQREELKVLQKEAVELTAAEKWSNATNARNRVLNRLQNMTGLATLYDLRRKRAYETKRVGDILQDEDVKLALGVDEDMVWEECSDLVEGKLHADVMKSVKPLVEELLKKTKVLLYQGQFDLRDGVVSTEEWINKLEWEELGGFLSAERKVWKVDGELAGYVQKWKSLTEVVVSGAGHLVPADQGKNSQVMIEGWVEGRGLFGDVKVNAFQEDLRITGPGKLRNTCQSMNLVISNNVKKLCDP